MSNDLNLTLEEFATLIKSLRDMQKKYFQTRDRAQLEVCKISERLIDRQVERILNPQKTIL